MAVKESVDSMIADHKVAVFSKSWCGFSKRARATLAEFVANQDDIKVWEIDLTEDEAAIQDYLQEKTGQRTVPNVFINQEHIGGNDAVQSAKASGKLQKLLTVA